MPTLLLLLLLHMSEENIYFSNIRECECCCNMSMHSGLYFITAWQYSVQQHDLQLDFAFIQLFYKNNDDYDLFVNLISNLAQVLEFGDYWWLTETFLNVPVLLQSILALMECLQSNFLIRTNCRNDHNNDLWAHIIYTVLSKTKNLRFFCLML